jgi:penicillin-binding protein 2
MAVLAAAVANGGTRYRPMILEAVKTAEGRILFQNKPVVIGKIPVSKRTLELVQRGLWGVVNSDRGTARASRLVDIEFSGKTGTSQVVGRKSDDPTAEEDLPAHLRPHAWFVAYAPSEMAEIAVAVLIEHGEHGSGAAAPVAREMIKTYLNGKAVNSRQLAQAEESLGTP